jgi:hypothetical protein
MTSGVESFAFGNVSTVREFYCKDAIGIVWEESLISLYVKILPLLFQKSFFLAQEQFFHHLSTWNFMTPNKDVISQSFVHLVNSGIYQFWRELGFYAEEKFDAREGFQKLFKGETEGRFLIGGVGEGISSLPMEDSLLTATLHFYGFGMIFAASAFACEIYIWEMLVRVVKAMWQLRFVQIKMAVSLENASLDVIHVRPKPNTETHGDSSD